MKRRALLATLGARAIPGAAFAADPDPKDFTPRGYAFCGWQDFGSSSGWTMKWNDNLAGAYTAAFARKMSCRAARRNVEKLTYSSSPPYAPRRAGYRCTKVAQRAEFTDVRCTKRGGSQKFRMQSGA